jgi:hypothetical protein
MVAPLETAIRLTLTENVTQGLALIISRLASAQNAAKGLVFGRRKIKGIQMCRRRHVLLALIDQGR